MNAQTGIEFSICGVQLSTSSACKNVFLCHPNCFLLFVKLCMIIPYSSSVGCLHAYHKMKASRTKFSIFICLVGWWFMPRKMMNETVHIVVGSMVYAMKIYSGTCVLWTPWDQQKVSRLSRCPDFPGHFI